MWKPVTFSRERLEEMLEMARENYGSENDIADHHFISHQYFENPAGNAVIGLAEDGEGAGLAGNYIVLPMRFSILGKNTSVVLSLNTLTRRNFRGQGIFTGLAEQVYLDAENQGYSLCYGMPNQNSYPGFLKRLRFQDIGCIPLYLRPLRPSDMVQEFLKVRPLSMAAGLFNPLFAASRSPKSSLYNIVPLEKENLDLADQFWTLVKKKYPVMAIRDGDWMSYRYLNVPRRNYRAFFALDKGVPVAFIAGRTMDVAGMNCGMLADFIFTDQGARAAEELLKFMLAVLQRDGACIAGCLMLRHTSEAGLLRRHGFFRCPRRLEPQPFPLIVRPFRDNTETELTLDLRNWFFTMGDYDVI